MTPERNVVHPVQCLLPDFANLLAHALPTHGQYVRQARAVRLTQD